MEVEFYESQDGEVPVECFLDQLPSKSQAKILRDLDLLSAFGTELREPYVKHMDGPLWELRSKFSSNIYRIIYFVRRENKIVLLHGFVKKTNKTPKAEIELAQKRYRDYQERNVCV